MTQPGHAIYWAELMYRARPTRETLEQFQEIVMQSAEFMVDYLWWDAKTGRYVLGPPLLTGSEASNWRTTCNSTVGLSYWFYGLRTAQLWRERLGLPREPKWDEILAGETVSGTVVFRMLPAHGGDQPLLVRRTVVGMNQGHDDSLHDVTGLRWLTLPP